MNVIEKINSIWFVVKFKKKEQLINPYCKMKQ